MHTTGCMSAYLVEIEARLRCMHAYTNFPSVAERPLEDNAQQLFPIR